MGNNSYSNALFECARCGRRYQAITRGAVYKCGCGGLPMAIHKGDKAIHKGDKTPQGEAATRGADMPKGLPGTRTKGCESPALISGEP